MQHKPKVIIVDDQRANRQLLLKTLAHEYHLFEFDNAMDCLQAYRQIKPDAFLLDIRMPQMDGFELCEKIKADECFADTPIIFLSALADLENKLNGYKLGADDYITKPLELDILKAKLQALLCRVQGEKSRTNEAMEMALLAMTNSSEIGLVNQFFEHLKDIDNHQDAAHSVLACCHNLGVNAVIQIRSTGNPMTLGNFGQANQLEQELLTLTHNAARIFSFGQRCIFNYGKAALLIKNMPKDEDKSGRFKDHLAAIMGALATRLDTLDALESLKHDRNHLLGQAVIQANSTLQELMDNFKEHDKRAQMIVEGLQFDLNCAYSYLNLTEEQEHYLNAIFENKFQQLLAQYDSSTYIDRQFQSLKTMLYQAINLDN